MIGNFFRKSAARKISLIVVVYDMEREAPRTLQSLSATYQLHVTPDDYEVIVVDNGSPRPLGAETVRSMGRNFQYHYIHDALPSPSSAVNFGVTRSSGDIIGVLIDGARIATPGLLHYAQVAFRAYEDPTVATLGWHLGPEPQQKSVAKGYNQEVEDQILSAINWPHDGYRLFEISSLASSSADGCFCPIAESNTIFLKRESFDEIGGYDPAFDTPGGGLVNLDFFRRACERKNDAVVILLGEGSFHQVHHGTSTNVSEEECAKRFQRWAAQYRDIRGVSWDYPRYTAMYMGYVPPGAMDYISWSANRRKQKGGPAL